jgi:hypothetical protein
MYVIDPYSQTFDQNGNGYVCRYTTGYPSYGALYQDDVAVTTLVRVKGK